ncbi:MAG: signal peptidase I [Clostridia bacterium]|nr:signal peptidase I [Clostridia bacterium]
MQKVKKVFSAVMAVITAALFIFGFAVFVSVMRAAGGQIPSVLGYSVMQIQTGSMEPEYEIGTVIVTKKTDAVKLKKGDVISFYSTDSLISGKVNTHRIVSVRYDDEGYPIFMTKGDANQAADRMEVDSERIIGKVIFNLGTVSGSVISVLQNPKVIFFLIVLPLIFITFGEAVNLVTMIAANREAKKFGSDKNDNEKPNDK